MNRRIALVLSVMVTLWWAGISQAAVPDTLTYQGKLTNSSGSPVNGTVSIVFSIYGVSTGGTALWSETQGSVNVASGIFTVTLGSVTPIPSTVFSNTDLYLGIKVGADAEMTPRQKLNSVPFAVKTGEADTLSGYKIADLDTRYGQSVPIQYPRTNTITTVDSTGTVGQYTSITIGADGLPVIAYYDSTNGDLKIAKCGNTACSSGNTITTVDSTGDVGKWTSITIGTDGLPIISYYDTASNGELKVAKCGDASCSSGNTITTVTTGGAGSDEGQSSSITIGTDGLPVISYLDTTNTALKVAKCGNASCSSGNTISIIETLAGTVNQTTSIIIGTDGLPLISYHHKNGTVYAPRVAKCGNSACSSGNIISNLDATTNIVAWTSITLGPDGLPVISYYDATNYDLKVAKCWNTSCSGSSLFTVDSAGDVGYYTSVTIGTDGLPIISYYDLTNTNGDLKVVKCGDTSCSSGNAMSNSDVSASTVGWYTSISIGTDGLPVISYWDATNGDLKVAKCANQYCINNWSRR